MLDLVTPSPDSDRFKGSLVPVRIQCGALDESELRGGTVVLRGRVATASLHRLIVDTEYQRGLENRPDIYEALRAGDVLPDVVLGCRGANYRMDGDDFILTDPTFIIDGSQRIGTARVLLEAIPDIELRMGCLVHFGTTQEFERDLFTALNRGQKKVNPNLHLRNHRTKSTAILTLFGLTENDKNFPLLGRVCWEQSMRRGVHLITAATMAKTINYLHAHHSGISGMDVESLATSLDAAAAKIGLQSLRQNTATFFQLIEDCWGIRTIEYRASAPQIKGAFMVMLARFLSRHRNFWAGEGERLLKVDPATRSKLRSFPIQDPQIVQLSGSGGTARELLYAIILSHVNKGRREHRLVERESA